ncbi:hypothetical protein [Pseudonocardia sp. NPDC049154]|uniref:hypothetical protein n=1 Tax=Pseudonocardia sp. NPDC049154 TaxID=3155501 RepID=UPI0033CEC84B
MLALLGECRPAGARLRRLVRNPRQLAAVARGARAVLADAPALRDAARAAHTAVPPSGPQRSPLPALLGSLANALGPDPGSRREVVTGDIGGT